MYMKLFPIGGMLVQPVLPLGAPVLDDFKKFVISPILLHHYILLYSNVVVNGLLDLGKYLLLYL